MQAAALPGRTAVQLFYNSFICRHISLISIPIKQNPLHKVKTSLIPAEIIEHRTNCDVCSTVYGEMIDTR